MKKIISFLIPVVLVVLVYSYVNDNQETYQQIVREKRSERIQYLKTSDQSPFQLFNVPFDSLSFFPINSDYRVRATIERIKGGSSLEISNSDGTTSRYQRYAYANFKLNGADQRLLILKPAGFGSMNTYFTGFADNTSGLSTYGGGRYLDLEIGKADWLEIDFNLAYNPYCAYVSGFSCPLPPAENILSVAIEAGEKDYTH